MTLEEKIKMLEYHTNVQDIDAVIEEVNAILTKKLPTHRIEREQADGMTIAAEKAAATASGRAIAILNELRYMNNTDKVTCLKTQVLPLLMNAGKLKALVITIGTGTTEATLEPTFNIDTMSYECTLPASNTQCKVKATVVGSATFKYKIGSGSETAGTSGTAFSVTGLSSAAGKKVTINVKDGDFTNSYKIDISVAAS